MKIAVGIRQVMHLEPLDLLVDLGAAGQQGRHDDDRPQMRRHAIAERESRQRARSEQRRDAAIHESHRQVRGRDDGQKPEQEQAGQSDARGARMEEGQREDQPAEDDERAEESRRRGRDIGATQPAQRRRPAAERVLEGHAPVPDERKAGRARAPERLPGDVQLGAARAPGELFDRVPVGVARREVQRTEVRVRAKHLVDQADPFEELGPVERGHQAHAQDHVADGHVHRRLTLMLEAHDVIGRRPLGRQAFVQPEQRRGDRRILIAQPLDELHREGGRERGALETLEDRRHRRRRLAVEAEQAVRQCIGILTRRATAQSSPIVSG